MSVKEPWRAAKRAAWAWAWAACLGGVALGSSREAPAIAAESEAGACRLLQVSFEPDCFTRDSSGICKLDVAHPDFGPQIAVWVESADGARFVDTVMVTNAVALYGIGNRPGQWDFRSGPGFPYGRRPMALPVWAHRRGVTYGAVTMDDGRDDEIASHEQVSSPEPHFCRPMMPSEVVDAITCASGNFRSAKGVFDATLGPSYYPPRGDLVDWGSICVPRISGGSACDYGDARQFGLLNDVDAVAAATPAYDRTFSASWSVPTTLADGDYALWVEVGKEFDANESFAHPSFLDPYETEFYDQYGLEGNVGQPSVVYRVDVQVSASAAAPGISVTAPSGYGDWTGLSGSLTPVDAQISDGPGTGSGRLRITDGPGGPGRVHVVGLACPASDCSLQGPPETPRIDEPTADQDPAAATFTFRQASDGGAPVVGYELRAEPYDTFQLDESTFDQWQPEPPPDVGSPGTLSTVTLGDLRPNTGYAVGMRAQGACGWSAPSFIRLHLGPARYQQLSGCVIATAAFGSDLHPDVALLRRARDWVVARSGPARLGAALYARSAPPVAALVARSETARAVVRSLLRPIVMAGRSAWGHDEAPVPLPAPSPPPPRPRGRPLGAAGP